MKHRTRAAIAFVLLFVLYQAAEGVGARLLGSFTVQAGLMLACVLAAWPLSRWLGYRKLGAWALEVDGRAMGWLAGGLLLAIVAKGVALWIGLRSGIHVHAVAAPPQALPVLLATLPMLMLSTFVPSIAEDILTRGFWYRASGIAWRRGLAFVAFSRMHGNGDGQIMAIIVMVVAACEVTVGLGVIVAMYRRRLPVDVDELRELHG